MPSTISSFAVVCLFALMNDPQMADYHFVLVLYSDAETDCEIVTDLSGAEYELLDAERYRIASRLEHGLVVYTGTLIPE